MSERFILKYIDVQVLPRGFRTRCNRSLDEIFMECDEVVAFLGAMMRNDFDCSNLSF